MLEGTCQYSFSPTEQYQHPEWGTHCGQQTYAGYEEVSTPRKQPDGTIQVETELVQRDQFDPYCPDHGGTPDPTKKPDPVPDPLPADPVESDTQTGHGSDLPANEENDSDGSH
jgi:hypothetical protein